jgi:hypothetical protein
MLRSYVPLGAALAICLATSGCAAPTNDATAMGFVAAPAPPELEEALQLSVDAVDVRHGSLRIEASMVDGSADVSMWLGPTCGTREVGRGFATPNGFAWSLSREDISRAIECNLVVRVRAIDEDGNRVRRTATLPVSIALAADSDGEDEVRLMRQESSGTATKMTFASPSRVDRLHIAGSIIGSESEKEEGPAKLNLSSFLVDNDDLALAIVGRRHLTLLSDRFLPTITIGAMTLDVSEPEVPEATVDEPVTSGDSCDDCRRGRGEYENDGQNEYSYDYESDY